MTDKSEPNTLKSLCECPVCFEPYKNPRLLQCGHQYCEKCLKDIVECHPQGHATCPICRDVTKPKHGDVTTLPRSTLHQYMQDLIFRQPTENALGQKCSKCKVNKPTRHCPECTSDMSNMCDKCFKVHQTFKRLAGHSTIRFDPLYVCSDHPHKMVENFCSSCQKVTCIECAFVHADQFPDHEAVPMSEAAENARKLLNDYHRTIEEKFINKDILTKIDELIKSQDSIRQDIKTGIKGIRDACRKLEKQMDTVENELDNRIDVSIQTLSRQRSAINDVHLSQEKMLKLCESLLSADVSDPQVILGSRDLPQPDIDFTEIQVSVPVIGDKLVRVEEEIKSLTKMVEVSYDTQPYDVRPGVSKPWYIKHQTDIKFDFPVYGICFGTASTSSELIVRIRDDKHPVHVYSADATLKQKLQYNGDYTGLIGAFRSLAMDTKRSLYLLPCGDGTLLRIHKDGTFVDKKKLGSNLLGVAYIPDSDLYVLSDYVPGNFSVFLVSADSHSVVRRIGDKGTFSQPCNVCVGEIDGCTTIVISDYCTHMLHLYTVDGRLLRTYGPDTGLPGQQTKLSFPYGVAVDDRGGFIVCDKDNSRVLHVWREKGEEHWECLLDKTKIGGQPLYVSINTDCRLMAISTGNNIKMYSY